MNRYEQRRKKLLQNKEVAAGYQEMAAELELMHAIDNMRKQLDMSQELVLNIRVQGAVLADEIVMQINFPLHLKTL